MPNSKHQIESYDAFLLMYIDPGNGMLCDTKRKTYEQFIYSLQFIAKHKLSNQCTLSGSFILYDSSMFNANVNALEAGTIVSCEAMIKE